jgi:hypothetical protein
MRLDKPDDRLRGRVWAQLRVQALGRVWDKVWDRVWGQVWDQVWGRIRSKP